MAIDDGAEVACALCGARDTRRLYTKWKWGIEQCRRCGLVYANPRASAEAILARYTSDYFWNEYLPAAGAPGGRVDFDFIDGRNAVMLRLIREQAPGARRMLEVGTGAGLFLKAAERAGWDVSGLELSAAGSAFARDTLGLDVRQERAEAMTFPPGSFDVAVMFDVIEHLFDPRAVLEATRRALAPGGVLLVSTPNFDALSRFALGVQWAVISPLEHLYYFTDETLARMLESTGFQSPRFVSPPSADWHPSEMMNYRSTHAPGALRAKAYAGLVRTAGAALRPLVRAAGRGDAILSVASV
jgi:SAM-dependent methyltransferase